MHRQNSSRTHCSSLDKSLILTVSCVIKVFKIFLEPLPTLQCKFALISNLDACMLYLFDKGGPLCIVPGSLRNISMLNSKLQCR